MKGTALIVVLVAASALADDLTCPSEWEIEKLLRHEDCNKFYKCAYGVPVEQSCYGNLHFNLETWQCDWPEHVDCGDRNDPTAPIPEIEESEEVSEEEVVPEEDVAPEEETPEEIPEEVIPEEVAPEEETPEEISEEVAPEEASPEEVPEEDAASEEEVTSEEEIPEEISEEIAPEQGKEEFLPNGCPVDPHVHWLVAAEELTDFYYCVWGELVLRNCPSPLHFNPVLQVCDWPQNVAALSYTSLNKHLESRKVLRNLD